MMAHKVVCNIPRVSSLYGYNMRDLFQAGNNQIQFGYDWSSLENRIQGHYVYKYEGGPELAETLLAEKPLDIHSINSQKLGISRDNAKAITYACVPTDNSEVLTPTGWKSYFDLKLGDSILTYNAELDQIEEDVIQHIHFYENAEVTSFSNTRDSFECTLNHRWYGKIRHAPKNKPKYYEHTFFNTDEITTEHSILMSAKYPRKDSIVTIEEARFLGWLLADGYYSWSGRSNKTSSSHGNKKGITCRIIQSKNKYQKELEKDLTSLNIKFTTFERHCLNGNHVKDYLIPAEYARELLTRLGLKCIPKHSVDWVSILLQMSEEARDNFVETFYLSDGHCNNKITQNYGKIHDAISLALYLQGNRISVTNKGNRCSVITKHSTAYLTAQRLTKAFSRKTDVFCVTTNNSTFILRQNKKFISITGNCLYGAAPPKLKKMLNLDDAAAEKMYTDFWDSVLPLKELRDNATAFWEKTNKEYVIGIDKRKFRVRSAHSIVNLLFQSAGSLAVKYTTMLVAQQLESQGLLGNLLKDSQQESEQKVNQCIVYHRQIVAL